MFCFFFLFSPHDNNDDAVDDIHWADSTSIKNEKKTLGPTTDIESVASLPLCKIGLISFIFFPFFALDVGSGNSIPRFGSSICLTNESLIEMKKTEYAT